MPTANTKATSKPSGSAGSSARLRATHGAGEASDLSRDMQALSNVIRELEAQLDRVMALNGTLQSDLAEERAHGAALAGELEVLRTRLEETEREMARRENLQAELDQLTLERQELTESLRALSRKLEEADQVRTVQDDLIQRLRACRTDAMREVESVESQFERAMQVLAQAKAQLTVAEEERTALRERLLAAEERLRQALQEREALLAEVNQSRAALDEIRSSLVDACVVRTGEPEPQPSGTGA